MLHAIFNMRYLTVNVNILRVTEINIMLCKIQNELNLKCSVITQCSTLNVCLRLTVSKRAFPENPDSSCWGYRYRRSMTMCAVALLCLLEADV